MIKLKDVEFSKGYYISLKKLIGKDIKDIQCYVTNEFGEPTLGVSFVVFDDDTKLSVEGEHDLPYLVEMLDKQPNFDEETLNSLYIEINGNEDDD